LTAAPVAALALVLTSVSPSVRRGSVGLPVRPVALGQCRGDDVRTIVVQVLADGQLTINSEQSNRKQLVARLEEILRTRWEKLVFVTAEPAVPFQSIAEVIDIAQISSYHVGLLPPIGRPTVGGNVCPEVRLRYGTTEPQTSDRSLPVWR
jgi:biopolymer transport protein ExbD